ncbi:hypothetical protein GCM10017596_11050 [Microbacterium keratanolyticum]|uniref:Uncharacterized protein n=2 Tax=Microbacterium keratanolyticum TaxID=67574 RepID=A0A9W6HS45_9MICO|nr:hypothetical protein GCM10017596_11050 [Microbacterium keratanolyticum]
MLRRHRDTVDLRWLSARSFTEKWYPQGIDVGVWQGRRALAVSWFRKDKTGQHLASRVTLIDPQRSRHLDLSFAIRDENGDLQPAQIHAGGLAWFDDRLFAAATNEGIWEFDLSEVTRLHRKDVRRVTGRRGFTGLAVVRTRVHPVSLRCSFLGRAFDGDGTPLPRVLIGEYRIDDRGRIGEFTIPDGPVGFIAVDDPTPTADGAAEAGAPGIPRMQGVARWGDQIFVSQSRGIRKPGRLWVGEGRMLQRSPIPLPVGTEDLALDPQDQMLWTIGEHPWKRVVRGIRFASLGI